MKVLQLIDSLNIGGAENLVTNSVIYNSKENINFELCVLYDTDSFLQEKLERKNIIIHSLHLKYKYDIRGIFTLIMLLRRNKFDLVHVHLFPALYFAALAAIFMRNTKFIYTEHSTYNRRRKKIGMALIDGFVYKRYSRIICICERAKEELIRYRPSLTDRIKVVYNGIPINAPVQRVMEYDVMLVASLRGAKGIDIFLKAAALISDNFNKAAIAGDGPLRSELSSLRDTLELKDKVEFLGKRSDVEELLEKSKVFVLSSRWEGIPISILEAMSKARPIVCTKVGGVPEILDESSGILVSCDEGELSEGIKKVLNDGDLAQRIGDCAYNRVKRYFSIETYINNIEQIYRSVLT